MARPKQILLIALVYSWGSIMAINQGYPWSSGSYLMGLGAAILISISIHYANEYADYETDKLTIRTLYSGGSGALQDLGLERSLALKGALLALLLGVVLGTIGLFLGDIPVHGVVMLIIAVILGWGYSLKPLALAWRGWGEVDNAFLGAILLPVYGFTVISLQVERSVIVASIPFGLLAFVNLLATHWADRAADHAVGKNTLANTISVNRLRWIYFLIILGVYIWVYWLTFYPQIVRLSSMAVLPLSIWGFQRFTKQHSPAPSVIPMVAFLIVQLISLGFVQLYM
jgi:1,4-dihydroxy-2-naphthoate octaprenyltransferase